ncbi:g11701 [Coccomyxa elongata]
MILAPGCAPSGGDAVEGVLRNPDILRLLFAQLELHDLIRVGAACKQWFAVAESDEFWKTLDFQGRGIRQEEVLSIVKRHPHVLSLNIQGIHHTARSLLALLTCLTSLRELSMGGGCLSEPELLQVHSNLSTLQQWTITQADLGRSSMTEVLLSHTTLPRLVLKKCRGSRLVVRCNALRELVIESCSFLALAFSTPVLTSLELRDCQKIADVGLRAALTRLTALKSLDVSHSVPLSDDTLREVGLACTQLTRLKARNCPGLTLNAIQGFPELRHLDLTGCDCIAPATAVPTLERWTNLESLTLDHCGLLTNLTLSLPHLRTISLRHCRALATVDLQCLWLEHLDLGPETSTTVTVHVNGSSNAARPETAKPQVLKRVVLASDAMTSLRWRECPALEQAVLACPFLREAHFDSCNALSDEVLHTLGDGSLPPALPSRYAYLPLRGGCPRLRSLILHNCGGLKDAQLVSRSIEHLSLANCRGLANLVLDCPSLQALQLEECNDLQTINLKAIGMNTLSLGTCPNLTSLRLSAPVMRNLDLKGCGMLSTLGLDCPALESLDATFCGRLGKSALAWVVNSSPPLHTLVLSVCSHLDANALEALGTLHTLRLLDLSYTEIQDLNLVFAACPGLETLKLSSCACLREDALNALLPPLETRHAATMDTDDLSPVGPSQSKAAKRWHALTSLKELDVSYCSLSTAVLANVIARGSTLQVLAINGCVGATQEIWEGLHAPGAPVLSLQALSAVGCKKLRSCWLGLQPASPADAATQQRLLAANMYSPPSSFDTAWTQVPVSVSGLQTLRLGLSGVRSLALALPSLTSLDVNNTAELRCLELRCPALLTAYVQACKVLPGQLLERAFCGCAGLETLDAQHSEVPPAAPVHLRACCPHLRVFLHTSAPEPQPPLGRFSESPESSG